MENEFKVGDLVRLKSGGPTMVVSEIADQLGDCVVWCKWFANNKAEAESFAALTLKMADADA